MTPVYRIETGAQVVAVERWSNWEAFDDAGPERALAPADLVYGFGPVATMGARVEGVFDIQRIRIHNGRAAHAMPLLQADLAYWSEAGAEVLGLFTVVHGNDLPAALLLLHWSSIDAALDAQAAVESAATASLRGADRRVHGQPAIRGTSRLLRPVLTFRSRTP